MIIRNAYDRVKSSYTYIEDVRRESGLPDSIFSACLRELAKSGAAELLPGTELWTEKQGFELDGTVFFGMTWPETESAESVKEEKTPAAFERLFERVREITAVMECADKKTAVSIIRSEFPEFSDITENTVKTNITSFPYLFSVLESERDGKPEPDAEQNETDRLQKENDSLKSDIQRYINTDIQHGIQLKNMQSEIEMLQKENDSLKSDIQRYIEKNIQQELQLKALQKKTDRIDTPEDIYDIQNGDIQMRETVFTLVKDVENLKRDVEILTESRTDIQKYTEKDIQEKKTLRLGKWSIVMQNGYYKAVRNFGMKKNGKKDIKQIYIGKEYREEKAEEKITAKGYQTD